MSDENALEAAQFCHDAGVVLSAVAELLHERAGMILASISTRGPHDRRRVEWAVQLADVIDGKGRHDEAERVLLAALALSEGIFGRDDPLSIETRRRLGAIEPARDGRAADQDGSSA